MNNYNKNLNNIIYNNINLTNNNDDNNIKEEKIKYSSLTHTNLYSSFRLNKNKNISIYDNFISKKPDLIHKKLFSQTMRNSKNYENNIINFNSSNISEKQSQCSPKNINFFHSSQYYYKKIFNKINPSDLRVNKISNSPKVYNKKTSLTVNRYKSSFEIKNFTISTESKINKKIEKNIKKNINKTKKRNIVLKEVKIENNNCKLEEIKPLNTLFVNRVKNIDNNFYSIHKKNNKSSEGFYINSNRNNKNNLISINKKNLFININNYQKINEEFNNINILTDDQPVANFSINFNNTLLNNNKNLSNILNKEELSMNNHCNTNETLCLNKKSLPKKKTINAKSYKSLEYFFQTPRYENNNYYNYLKTLKNEGNNSTSNSFYKLLPQKKLKIPTELINSLKEKPYNNTIYNEEKTLNKIKSYGGIRMIRKKTDNSLKKKLTQNTFKSNNNKGNKINEINTKKKNNNKGCSNFEKKISMNKYKKSSEIITDDILVLDLSCLKFSLYEDLINKICKTLKKNKIKYCFMNNNKIHCSGINGVFFDIEIYNIKSKKISINKNNNNINTYKSNNISNENYSIQKVGYTSIGFKKITRNNTINNQNQKKELYYVNFCNKNTEFNIFNKNKGKLIHDIIY